MKGGVRGLTSLSGPQEGFSLSLTALTLALLGFAATVLAGAYGNLGCLIDLPSIWG